MPTKVVQIEPTLTIDEDTCAISAFSIILLENEVPSIQCIIDYSHKDGDKADATAINSIQPLMELYKKFKEKVNKNTKCNFEVKVLEDGKQTQFLKVSEWILENVGIQETSVGSTMGISVAFRHPVCQLEKCIFRLDGILTVLDHDYYTKNAKDVLAAYIEVLTKYKEQLSNVTKTPQELDEFRFEVIASLEDALKILQEKIIYTGAYDLQDLDQNIIAYRYAWIVNRVMDSEDKANLWELLSKQIVPGYLLRIRPAEDLNDKLVISTANYWDTPIKLNEENIVSLQAPPIAYNKINRIYYFERDLLLRTCSDKNADKDAMAEEKMKAAIYPEKKPESNGLTISRGLPAYFPAMSQLAGTKNFHGDPNTDANMPSEMFVKEKPETYKFGEKAIKHMKNAYLPALLQRLYMVDSTVTVKSRLNIGNSSIHVPGLAYIIGELRFYCTAIVHTVDLASKTATTEYAGSHCTTSLGGEDPATKPGTQSKLYLTDVA